MDGSFPYMQNDISLFSFDQTKETPWYRRLQEKNSGRHWLPPGFILDSQENPSDFFSYLGILYDPANLQRPVGMLRVDLAREKVDRALENLRLSEHVAVFLAEDNRLLYGLPEKGNLPQQAVTRTGQADVVTIVAADGTLSQRPVRISGSQGSNWIVVDGLQAGEKVMVDGF